MKNYKMLFTLFLSMMLALVVLLPSTTHALGVAGLITLEDMKAVCEEVYLVDVNSASPDFGSVRYLSTDSIVWTCDSVEGITLTVIKENADSYCQDYGYSELTYEKKTSRWTFWEVRYLWRCH